MSRGQSGILRRGLPAETVAQIPHGGHCISLLFQVNHELLELLSGETWCGLIRVPNRTKTQYHNRLATGMVDQSTEALFGPV